MKFLFLLLLATFTTLIVHAQTDIPISSQSGPMGAGGSWLRFLSGGTNYTSIQESWGLTLIGEGVHPVKIYNASLLIGYPSTGESYTPNNLLVKGNVGIGTITPVSPLSIVGGANILEH